MQKKYYNFIYVYLIIERLRKKYYMNIVVVGSGYVGLVSGTCFSEMGNKVTCVDIDQKKIDKLHEGIIPIYEPGLEKMVLKNVENKNLFFTTNLEKQLVMLK